jgi:hypothetical protein
LTNIAKLKSILTVILLIFLCVAVAYPQSSKEQTKEEKARKRALKQEAALSLWRFKRVLEKEGFYSGRVALNIWRSNAIDAGTFDQEQYDEFKQALYEKSVMKSLECFENFTEKQRFNDANMCLQTWKVHSEELGIFDQTVYDDLTQKLSDAREKKIEEDKKMHEQEQ